MIASGQAREKFREIVGLQGGDVGVIDDPQRLARARQTRPVVSAARGYISSIACEQLGVASVVLGGGREKKEDTIDPAVGLEFHKRIGDAVERGEPLCTLHYNSEARLAEALHLAETAFRVDPEKPKEDSSVDLPHYRRLGQPPILGRSASHSAPSSLRVVQCGVHLDYANR